MFVLLCSSILAVDVCSDLALLFADPPGFSSSHSLSIKRGDLPHASPHDMHTPRLFFPLRDLPSALNPFELSAVFLGLRQARHSGC